MVKKKLVIFRRNFIFVSRFAFSVTSHVPFKPYVPTLIVVSSLHEISTVASNKRTRKKKKWSKTTNRRDLDVTIVTRGSCRIAAIEIVRLIPSCILRVMPMRKHRCKNLSNETINNLLVKMTGLSRWFLRASFLFLRLLIKQRKRKLRKSWLFLLHMRESKLFWYVWYNFNIHI